MCKGETGMSNYILPVRENKVFILCEAWHGRKKNCERILSGHNMMLMGVVEGASYAHKTLVWVDFGAYAIYMH